jgi:D-glycero-alpha-D-manno-heptose-7-phosphate kinase
MITRARAPFRIDLAGGGTDVLPFTEHGIGKVLNFTIDKYATVTIKNTDDEACIESLDYDICETIQNIHSGPLLMIRAVFEFFMKENRILESKQNIKMTVQSDAPPGSGIGSSSTVCVCVLGALGEHFNIPITRFKIACDAYRVEREIMNMSGGSQDQFAAAFGGFNLITFRKDVRDNSIYPLRLNPSVLKELQTSFLLVDTGKSHNSGAIIDKQKKIYVDDRAVMHSIYLKSAAIAEEMVDLLVKERTENFFDCITVAHRNKIKFCDLIESGPIASTFNAAVSAGAKGCRILGAGGGGHMLIACDITTRKRIIKVLEGIASPVNFMFESDGLHSWKI